MTPTLARKLIENGAIRQGTNVEAYYNAHGLSGFDDTNLLETFSVKTASITPDGMIVFVVYGGSARELRRFTCEEIISIDGMDANRVAKTYNLTVNGETANTGKRRGRKPRNQTEEME